MHTYVTSPIPMSHLHPFGTVQRSHTAQIYEMASDLCELQASQPDLLPQYIEGVGPSWVRKHRVKTWWTKSKDDKSTYMTKVRDPTASHLVFGDVERCWKRVACPSFCKPAGSVQIGVKVDVSRDVFPAHQVILSFWV